MSSEPATRSPAPGPASSFEEPNNATASAQFLPSPTGGLPSSVSPSALHARVFPGQEPEYDEHSGWTQYQEHELKQGTSYRHLSRESTSSLLPSPFSQDTRRPANSEGQYRKRKGNTEAARRYRQRKVERENQLEEKLKAVTHQRDELRGSLEAVEGELRAVARERDELKDKLEASGEELKTVTRERDAHRIKLKISGKIGRALDCI